MLLQYMQHSRYPIKIPLSLHQPSNVQCAEVSEHGGKYLHYKRPSRVIHVMKMKSNVTKFGQDKTKTLRLQ